MSIKLRLYGGFGVLVVLMLGLVLYGVHVFSSTATQVGKMDVLATHVTRALQTEDDFEKLRRSALRYAYDHDEPSLEENGKVAVAVLSNLQLSEKEALSEDRQKIYHDLQASL